MKQAQKSYQSLNTLKMYLGFGGEDYWHIDYAEYDFPYDGHHYFWNLSKKAILCKGPFDEHDIITFNSHDKKLYYHVINLCHYAIGAYEMYLETKKEKWIKTFLKHADWLCETQTIYRKIKGVWINNYPIDLYGIYGSSVSAMTQGIAISTLTRAYLATKNEKYLQSAIKAVEIFKFDIQDGGVVRKLSDNFICYEEYPTQDSPCCVLNGFITALLGLYDLTHIYKSSFIENIYNQGLTSLIKNLYRWDYKWWSLYDLYNWGTNNIASFFYHKYHIKQLSVLYKLTNISTFGLYKGKWEKYLNNSFNRIRALTKKIIFRLNGRT